MKTCVIYARCSTRDQETENQVSQLKNYAAKQDWQVVDTVVDVCSGGKDVKQRPGLDKVFDMARRRQFDLLLFWALDRFSREGSRKTIQYLSVLDDCGVDWHSFSEPYISSLGIFKDAIIAILSALAKQEKVRISERTKAGLERTRRDGTRLGRPRTAHERFNEARKLRSQGLSYGAIGKAMGVSRARVCQMIKTARQDSKNFSPETSKGLELCKKDAIITCTCLGIQKDSKKPAEKYRGLDVFPVGHRYGKVSP